VPANEAETIEWCRRMWSQGILPTYNMARQYKFQVISTDLTKWRNAAIERGDLPADIPIGAGAPKGRRPGPRKRRHRSKPALYAYSGPKADCSQAARTERSRRVTELHRGETCCPRDTFAERSIKASKPVDDEDECPSWFESRALPLSAVCAACVAEYDAAIKSLGVRV